MFGVSEAGFSRDAQLRQLDAINPTSIRQQQAIEQARADAQIDYLVKSAAVRTNAIDTENSEKIQDLRDSFDAGKITKQRLNDRIDAILKGGAEQGRQIESQTLAEIDAARGSANQRSTSLQRDSQLKQFESLRTSAEGLLNSLFTKARNLGQVVGDFFKLSVLAPLEKIASAQVSAGLFRFLNPGSNIAFDSTNARQGRFGGIAGALSGLGLGVPFVQSAAGGTTALAPTQVAAGSTGGYAALPFGLGSIASLSASVAGQTGLNFGGDLGSSSGVNVSAPVVPVAPSGIPTFIGPGGTSGFAGPVGAGTSVYGSGSVGGGNTGFGGFGSLGNFLHGVTPLALIGTGAGLALSGIRSPRQTVGSSLSTVAGTGLIGAGIGLQVGGRFGGVIGAEAGLGGGLVLDGARRRSALGFGESIAGGALAGAAIGSIVPGVGTLVGAGIGAAVGLGASLIGLFVKSGRDQVKEQVKSLYKLDLNNQIADQLLDLAKQSYGGSISVAIRSNQALDLLSLYAQATGQPFLFKNSPRAAYITESGGTLTQDALNIGGKNYSFGGSLGVTNRVSTATIPEYNVGSSTVRSNGVNYGVPNFSTAGAGGGLTIQLDGAATTNLLQGQAVQTISNNPKVVSDAVSTATQGSYNRRATAAQLLNPGLRGIS